VCNRKTGGDKAVSASGPYLRVIGRFQKSKCVSLTSREFLGSSVVNDPPPQQDAATSSPVVAWNRHASSTPCSFRIRPSGPLAAATSQQQTADNNSNESVATSISMTGGGGGGSRAR